MRLSKDNPVKKLWDWLRASDLRDYLDEDRFGEAAMYMEEEVDVDIPLTNTVRRCVNPEVTIKREWEPIHKVEIITVLIGAKTAYAAVECDMSNLDATIDRRTATAISLARSLMQKVEQEK